MEWTGGIVEWKIYFQILHPNKAQITISLHINTLYVLNEVSIDSSNDGNTKKTLDLTLIYIITLFVAVKIKSMNFPFGNKVYIMHLAIRYNFVYTT